MNTTKTSTKTCCRATDPIFLTAKSRAQCLGLVLYNSPRSVRDSHLWSVRYDSPWSVRCSSPRSSVRIVRDQSVRYNSSRLSSVRHDSQSVSILFWGQATPILFDQSVSVLFGQSVSTLFGQSVSALFGQSVSLRFGQSVLVLCGRSVSIENTLWSVGFY